MESTTFTELCKTIEVHGSHEVATHPLFREMALGSISMQRFQRFVQQDHLWLKKYFPNFAIMADKEINPTRKQELTSYSVGSAGWMNIMESYYKEFDFEPATTTDAYVQNYIDFMRNTALNSSVGESLAALYPAHILWYNAGLEMAKVANYEDNVYSRMVKFLTADGTISLQKFQTFINDYYDRASEQEKRNMQRNYAIGVQMEIDFCNGVFRVL